MTYVRYNTLYIEMHETYINMEMVDIGQRNGGWLCQRSIGLCISDTTSRTVNDVGDRGSG